MLQPCPVANRRETHGAKGTIVSLRGCRGRDTGHTRTRASPSRWDTHREMSGESTTPDLVELVRRLVEAVTRFDFDAAMSLFAPDAVVEGRASGMTFEGRTAIRGFYEDMTVAYEELESRSEEILDLGNGV